MEDLDGIGESRINGNTNNKISELLQFINGIGSLKGDIVIIATTNYIELLDTSIYRYKLD
jgi:ATP-dependent Zn protease